MKKVMFLSVVIFVSAIAVSYGFDFFGMQNSLNQIQTATTVLKAVNLPTAEASKPGLQATGEVKAAGSAEMKAIGSSEVKAVVPTSEAVLSTEAVSTSQRSSAATKESITIMGKLAGSSSLEAPVPITFEIMPLVGSKETKSN